MRKLVIREMTQGCDKYELSLSLRLEPYRETSHILHTDHGLEAQLLDILAKELVVAPVPYTTTKMFSWSPCEAGTGTQLTLILRTEDIQGFQ